MKTRLYTTVFLLSVTLVSLIAQTQETPIRRDPFQQLYLELPTPNVYRSASGAPGHAYWQQKADYRISIRLDDENQRITGEEWITYHNNSPDALEFLWLQLDQNLFSRDSETKKITQNSLSDRMSFGEIERMLQDFDGGFKLDWVGDNQGKALSHTVVHTMMRIDLEKPLAPGTSTELHIKWWYNINDRSKLGGRSGYEYFESDGNYLYTIAQFFPRMAVYIDDEGWQNKQFHGRGEFALPFGDYEVEITVPSDHLVAATGVLQNPMEVLTKKQQLRFEQAQYSYEKPVVIATEEEARQNEKSRSDKTQTWKFSAENVRDFAFASSRKFIWDGMAVKMESGKNVLAMSMYPKEGNPLWEQYSTKVVAHTLKWYSHYTFDYPYPVAWSIHTDRIGMEYPMICFNGGRPEPDGTYSERTKYGMISVIVHEVGHNYFPMIVNSDERQWTWMDEGLNSFLQYLTEQQWERDYPSRRGPARNIVDYMRSPANQLEPIMTNSESLVQFGNNAYGKPATALNILRETILGRELFDYSFKVYANRWMFKHPSPADFFRTMEESSGIDLDWFWRGWFFGTEPVDISINNVRWLQIDTKNPEVEKLVQREERDKQAPVIDRVRNKEEIAQTQDEIDPTLRDFYSTYDPLAVTPFDRQAYEKYLQTLGEDEKALLASNLHFFEVSFENIGGLVMPIILELTLEDGTTEIHRIPAEIWRFDDRIVTKVFVTKQPVTQFTLDPFLETADIETTNNHFPPKPQMDRFELFKAREQSWEENPMQKARRLPEEPGKKQGRN